MFLDVASAAHVVDLPVFQASTQALTVSSGLTTLSFNVAANRSRLEQDTHNNFQKHVSGPRNFRQHQMRGMDQRPASAILVLRDVHHFC